MRATLLTMEPTKNPSRRLPWLTIILAILAVLAFFGNAHTLNEIMPTAVETGSARLEQVGGTPTVGNIRIESDTSASQAAPSMMPPVPYYNQNDSVTDTREFLKPTTTQSFARATSWV